MHFVGILAADFPGIVQFSGPLTLISFLICVLVVGIAAFWEGRAIGALPHTEIAALLMGTGIVSMHFLGMHAIHGPFAIEHGALTTVGSTVIAVATSYGALRLIEKGVDHRGLALSAIVFGLAVSGMHYTAMAGMTLKPAESGHHVIGPLISTGSMTIIVAILGFLISGAFLLYLIPEAKERKLAPVLATQNAEEPSTGNDSKPQTYVTIPVETEGAVRLIPVASICSVQATTHYTLVYDGSREYFSPWSISEAETKLAPQGFLRVHRSHLVRLEKVESLRRSGDGGLIEIGQPIRRLIPVSRSHYAELKARLGLQQKLRPHSSLQ
jgi:NO-binding membrane sensor protein with MHYT domain